MNDFLMLFLGLLLLLAGGAALVRGASGIAEGYGISPLVVGLTVVAFGTSSPELVVNILGALQGESELAFGNIAGSNLANIGLVLGSAALITPIVIQGQIIRRELPLLLLATTILLVMILDELLRNSVAMLDRADGIILLLLFFIFVYLTVLDFLRQKEDPKEDPLFTTIDHLSPKIESNLADWGYVVGGMIGLGLGGQLTVDSGVALAERIGLPTAVVGLGIVAIGTSLPELVTSVIAAMRKQADLCVGNVIGSNIFNSLLVLPISALVSPLNVPVGGVNDIFVSLLIAVFLIPVFFLGKRVMSRPVGFLFLAAYLSYLTFRIVSA